MIVLRFPSQFTGSNFYSMFTMISNSELIENKLYSEILIDYKDITFIDTEGTNYLILIPFLLKSYGKIKVSLPESNPVLNYLRSVGALKIIEENFDILYSSYRVRDFKIYEESYISSLQRSIFVNRDSNETDCFLALESYMNFRNFSSETLSRMSKCIFELIYNIFEHSGKSYGVISTFVRKNLNSYKYNDKAVFCMTISDIGMGIKKSMLKSNLYVNEKNIESVPDEEFILSALKKGISSTNNINRGLGLYNVNEISDTLTITSGSCRLVSKNKSSSDKRIIEKEQIPLLKGTSISVAMKIDKNEL